MIRLIAASIQPSFVTPDKLWRDCAQPRCPIAHAKSQHPFQFVEEDNAFLALFPHRYDFIWAAHTTPNTKVEWQTETRYPLSDRIIQQGSNLYGVRFGSQTQYFLLDIDIHSPYHPNQDQFAIPSILAALEPLGIFSYVGCTSSYSGGLHLYFPFQQLQNSWKLAIAVATLLENAGFKLHPGQLELFPNPKPYSTEPTLFTAHRLPLQVGSYLIDQDFQPIWSSRDRLVEQWQFAQSRNELDADALKRILKQLKRPPFQVSGKADKFLNDLNAEIEAGWTGDGQTNRLLGRITMRTYIFHHVLSGGIPLEGQALIDEIVAIARSLPGYLEGCRHQHEIEHRAAEWARCIEKSHYFHYGERAKRSNPEIATEPTWNQQQSEDARERIRGAIADLLETETLAVGATERFKQLLSYGIGGSTLYRHRDLWHPSHLTDLPQTPSSFKSNCPLDRNEGASNGHCPTSLFPSDASNAAPDNHFGVLTEPNLDAAGRNATESVNSAQIYASLQETQLRLQAEQEARRKATELVKHQQEQHKNEIAHSKQIERMQQFLNSGDSILISEAMTWAQAHPNILDFRQWAIAFDCSAQIKQEHLHLAITHLFHQLDRSLQQINDHLIHQFNCLDLLQLDSAEMTALLVHLRSHFLDSS